jgi:protein O-GlcNAc transferase
LHRGREVEALEWCDRALAVRPDAVEALNIRAQTLRALNRAAEAAATNARLLALAPDFDYARGQQLYSQAAVCDWTGHGAEVEAIVAAVAAGRRTATPMAFLSFCGDPELQLACARTFVADTATRTAFPGAIGRRGERIRLAYVSADFNDHPVAHLLAGVLERHDRERFEVYAVSIDPAPPDSPMRRRIAAAVDHFFEGHLESDRELAMRLRGLNIDVAVDLNGHTRGGRPGLFALRPAPVQVNYLGYTGTNGAEFMDYVIGDAVALPAALDTAFTERIVRLPYGFLPHDDRQPIASTPTRADACLPPHGFVYCAFNNPYKINPGMFDVWMQLVRETPGSVLWLKGGEGALLDNLRGEAARRGVDPARLLFAPRVAAMDEHLARYRLADLFLDSLPYGAHATARDALWAGLPVLTFAGDAFATRVAASLLFGLGLDELVVRSPAAYVRRALELARDPARLGAIRNQLAQELPLRPLFRTERYTRDLESAYDIMVDRARKGDPPQSFAVPSAEATAIPSGASS